MSAAPEEFMAQGAYLAAPEPFSPSMFLDLPPTPRTGRDDPTSDDPASSDDLDLSFISRMLMEEDIDDKFFYQFPDHPALLNAQQPYAQILSDATASCSSDSAAATTSSGTGSKSTISSSSDAPASADPTWPYDPIELSQLLRSPLYQDMGLGLDDFTADEVNAVFLLGQEAAFQPSPAFLDTAAGDGGGGQGLSASLTTQNAGCGGAQQQRASLVTQDAGRGVGIQRSACAEEETKTEVTTLPAGEGDHATLFSAFFSAQNGENMDMLNMAFLKGMEEAKKFLPTNNSLLINLDDTSGQSLPKDTDIKPSTAFVATQVKEVDGISMFAGSSNGRGRKNRHSQEDLEVETGRNSKLMMPEQEETGASELFDELMSSKHDGFLKQMQDLRIAMDSESEKSARRVSGKGARGKQHGNEFVDQHTMLIHCAQAMATGDRRSATEMLKQINQHSSRRGDATQRLAYCFAEGLEARLAGTGSQVYQSLVAKRTSVVEFLKAYKLFLAAVSLNKVHTIFSNRNIMNAVAGRSKLHIVTYGVHGFGLQWPGLLHLLAGREGGPPEVRFTGIDLPQPGFRPAYQIEETGRRLSNCAREFGVPFKFRAIAAKWETICAEDLNIDPDEVLAVNSECHFSSLMDESVDVDTPSPRDLVLNNIRKMRPNIFIQIVSNGTYGAPFFLTRFREALFYYSALFDMLDATIPRDNEVRLLIERDIIGRSALNVIACEGADRLDRPETYKQWQVRNHRAGLKQLPLNPDVVKLAREKVKNYYHKDFLIDEDHRWLLQGWKGRVLFAMSTWVAEDNNSIF